MSTKAAQEFGVTTITGTRQTTRFTAKSFHERDSWKKWNAL